MPKEKARLAIMAPTLTPCNYLLRIKRGFLLKQGLEVEVVIRPGRRNTDAIATDDVDFPIIFVTALRERKLQKESFAIFPAASPGKTSLLPRRCGTWTRRTGYSASSNRVRGPFEAWASLTDIRGQTCHKYPIRRGCPALA